MTNRLQQGESQTGVLEDMALDARRDSLAQRLEDGYRRIDEAAIAGADIAEWESFWIRLLGEYEDVCRELDLAA